MSIYEGSPNRPTNGRDVVARLFVTECLTLVALGRILAKFKNPDKELTGIREDVLALAERIRDPVLKSQMPEVVDSVLAELKVNIDLLRD